MTEEGFLAFPQRRARGEGRHAVPVLKEAFVAVQALDNSEQQRHGNWISVLPITCVTDDICYRLSYPMCKGFAWSERSIASGSSPFLV